MWLAMKKDHDSGASFPGLQTYRDPPDSKQQPSPRSNDELDGVRSPSTKKRRYLEEEIFDPKSPKIDYPVEIADWADECA